MLFIGTHGAHDGSSVITETGPVSFALAKSDVGAPLVVGAAVGLSVPPLLFVHDTATTAVTAITPTSATPPMIHFTNPRFCGGGGVCGQPCCGFHCGPGCPPG
ncbi:hypothetical protein AWB94_05165 [Mycolicibacterium canariasense]|nr:hypothetical protein AWB94_05165 [Mycolicibacterium canariasense]